jgi:hypothetical protein
MGSLQGSEEILMTAKATGPGAVTLDVDRLRIEYFELGFQYYIVARFAASEGATLSPVVGNLFHHAVEMLLKGALTDRTDEAERRRWSHNLQAAWQKFKTEIGNASLSSFDLIISELHKFESIRYPERIISQGMTCTVGFGKETPTTGAPRTKTRYHIFVGDMDALVKAIVVADGINPAFFTTKYQRHARKYLRRFNRSKATRLW